MFIGRKQQQWTDDNYQQDLRDENNEDKGNNRICWII